MQDKLERLIKGIYKSWKAAQPDAQPVHPDEEAFACFLEGRLAEPESERLKAHLIVCDSCAEILETHLKLKTVKDDVPSEALGRAQKLIQEHIGMQLLEIILKLKEKALEIISTTGDVLVGQELVPAPLLRSRSIKDFQDEVTILKDFQDIRVEMKVENKQGNAFNLTVMAKDKKTQELIKDLRVTLLKEDTELESYLTDSGKVTFERTQLGKYTVEISTLNAKLASILLDIKI